MSMQHPQCLSFYRAAHAAQALRKERRTGSLQKSESMKCCSRRCRNTATPARSSPGAGAPQPKWCSTGGRTCAPHLGVRVPYS